MRRKRKRGEQACSVGCVGVAELAAHLKCTTRHIQTLVSKGMPKRGHGQYDLVKCLVWAANFYREDSVQPDKKARTRLVAAQAEREELLLAKDRSQVLPIDIHQELVARRIATTRQRLMAFPQRVAPMLEGESRQVIKARLNDAVVDVLTALSQEEPGADLYAEANSLGAQARKGDFQ